MSNAIAVTGLANRAIADSGARFGDRRERCSHPDRQPGSLMQ
ncbi:MAG TPA: hypothetical protein VHE32_11975 [Rhodanobacteraceae bacterium]|jgi:hypothetical protein|nr:hypothetical protein [Rhodanobacteraceae bacterium]